MALRVLFLLFMITVLTGGLFFFLGTEFTYSEGEPEPSPTPKPTPPGDCDLYDTTSIQECTCSESMCGGTLTMTIDWACNGKYPENQTCVSDTDATEEEKEDKKIKETGPCDTSTSCVRGTDCDFDEMQKQVTWKKFDPCHCEADSE